MLDDQPEERVLRHPDRRQADDRPGRRRPDHQHHLGARGLADAGQHRRTACRRAACGCSPAPPASSSRPHGILVVGVGPGAVDTPINTATEADPAKMKTLDAAIPLGRMAKPEEIGERRRVPRRRRRQLPDGDDHLRRRRHHADQPRPVGAPGETARVHEGDTMGGCKRWGRHDAVAGPERDGGGRRDRRDDPRLRIGAADAAWQGAARLRRQPGARGDRRQRPAPARRHRSGGVRARPGAPMGIRVGVRPVARHIASAILPGAVGGARLRGDADVGDADACSRCSGKTPPPWKWPPDVLATSFGTHAAYVGSLALVDDTLGKDDRERPGSTGH